ncbi:MAG: glycosyltransferase family 2 protein [Vulcanimicrobiaceae bacterium]
MRFSVVIATRDRAAALERVLGTLARQRGAPAFDVVVVDNGSRDGTAALVREHARTSAFALGYVFAAEPNRGVARNAGVRAARGDTLVFVDDDVRLPEHFLFAHASAHARRRGRAISGPILNVPAARDEPRPTALNYSGAYFCTCNVSVARAAFDAVGGFDEAFTLYGWEDTELGLRLRRSGVGRGFAWDAYLWHIKPPHVETLETVAAKTVERGRMAARLLRKDDGLRTRLATGAYAANLARSAMLSPAWSLPGFRRLATAPRVPALVRAIARGHYLDGTYRAALCAALADREHDR